MGGGLLTIRLAPLAVVCVIGFVAGCGSARPGYTPYREADDSVSEMYVPPESVTVRFSTLSSLQPYLHVSTAGLAVKAPARDPREFCSPDSLAAMYVAVSGLDSDPAQLMGLPSDEFEALGEISVPLYVKDFEIPPSKYKDVEGEGPHGKPYKDLENVDWEAAFDRLRWRAARVGADAVIEVMGGRIPLTIWYPPKMPVGLELSGGTTVRLVRGEAITEWALVGIAVVWREQNSFVGSRD